MIKHNNKKCTVVGCEWPLYARGYCISHYRSLYLARKPQKPKLSLKRTLINEEYKDNRELFITNERNKHPLKKIFCIFCGKEILGNPSLHHGLGRDEDIMLDEHFWFLSHNVCHVHEYHSKGWNKLPWWFDYLSRIKDIPEIVKIESNRMEK